MKPNEKLAQRIYAALLHLYPTQFRRSYSHELTLLFVDMHRAAAAQGMPGVIDLWLHTFADLVFSALRERIMERSRVMFSPKVILWGGVASIFGGLFWWMMVIAPSGGGVSIVLALVLGLGGLASLYSRQAGQGGKLGLAGFALGIIGTVLALAALGWAYTNIFVGSTIREINESVERAPALAAQGVLFIMLAEATLGIGLALLGVATLRAKTLHRWRGLPLGLGLLYIVGVITSWPIFYVPLSQGRNPWFAGRHPVLRWFT